MKYLILAALWLVPAAPSFADGGDCGTVTTATCYVFPASFTVQNYVSQLKFTSDAGDATLFWAPTTTIVYTQVNTDYVTCTGAVITQKLNESYSPVAEFTGDANSTQAQFQASEAAALNSALAIQLANQCTP